MAKSILIPSASSTYEYPSNIGILICGHGSRDPIALKEFKQLASKVAGRLPGIPLEFVAPVIIAVGDPELFEKLVLQTD